LAIRWAQTPCEGICTCIQLGAWARPPQYSPGSWTEDSDCSPEKAMRSKSPKDTVGGGASSSWDTPLLKYAIPSSSLSLFANKNHSVRKAIWEPEKFSSASSGSAGLVHASRSPHLSCEATPDPQVCDLSAS
jgi:hypothetical protein